MRTPLRGMRGPESGIGRWRHNTAGVRPSVMRLQVRERILGADCGFTGYVHRSCRRKESSRRSWSLLPCRSPRRLTVPNIHRAVIASILGPVAASGTGRWRGRGSGRKMRSSPNLANGRPTSDNSEICRLTPPSTGDRERTWGAVVDTPVEPGDTVQIVAHSGRTCRRW